MSRSLKESEAGNKQPESNLVHWDGRHPLDLNELLFVPNSPVILTDPVSLRQLEFAAIENLVVDGSNAPNLITTPRKIIIDKLRPDQDPCPAGPFVVILRVGETKDSVILEIPPINCGWGSCPDAITLKHANEITESYTGTKTEPLTVNVHTPKTDLEPDSPLYTILFGQDPPPTNSTEIIIWSDYKEQYQRRSLAKLMINRGENNELHLNFITGNEPGYPDYNNQVTYATGKAYHRYLIEQKIAQLKKKPI
jgi:hypothetical protein